MSWKLFDENGAFKTLSATIESLVTTAGDMLYATAAQTLARLAPGLYGQYLGMNSGATAPAWTTQDGWIPTSATWTYASATTFTVSGDVTATFAKGTKIKLTQTTVKYFYVVSSSYGAPNTTVTVTGGSDYSLADAAITSPFYSYADTPQGFPHWFAYTAALVAGAGSFTEASATGRFAIRGRSVFQRNTISIVTNGTASSYFSVSTALTVAQSATGSCKEYSVTGYLANFIASGDIVGIQRYDGAYIGGDGYNLVGFIVYEF